ncbi:MAG: DUF342 domain-containing protein [Spirochaetales bacterium]|nr:DUF342 domain-containing protein [Spirochaetales bacterium]
MTDISSLLRVNGKHLYLANWNDDTSTEEDIKIAVRNFGDGFELYPDDFYRFLAKKWKGKLKKYPVGHKGYSTMIYLSGMVNMIPFIMLPDLLPLYLEVEKTISRSVIGSKPPNIGGFVKQGDKVLEIFGDPEASIELFRLIKSRPELVKRERSDESTSYFAKKPGYVIITKKGLDIVSPVRIDEDKSSLKFIILPVVEGFEERNVYFWDYLMNHKSTYPEAPVPDDGDFLQTIKDFDPSVYEEFEAISGKRPVDGYNSKLEFPLDDGKSDKEKDRVNFHDYSNIIIIREGKIFARKTLYREGLDGLDIYGNKMVVPKGKDVPITLTGDIQAEEQGDIINYRAVTSGIAYLEKNNLILRETLIVEGNVDFHTGNIKFKGDIVIRGDVKAGFSVISGGKISIEGSIENGAHVRTSEELQVSMGIIGKETLVESGKNIYCSFIQNSTVSSRNSITVEKNISGAKVYCRGFLTVEGRGLMKKRIGVVNGSECSAFEGMELLSAGSELNETVLRIGYDYFIEEKIREMNQVRSTYELKMKQIMQTLPPHINNVERLKLLSPEKRVQIIETLKRLKVINGKIHEFDLKKEKMLEFLYNTEDDNLSILLEEGLKAPVTVQILKTKDQIPANPGRQEITLYGGEIHSKKITE